MHIVFIVGSYYPYYSAVGKCVGNVADELAKGNKVTVICQKNFIEQEDVEVFNNQRIIRVETMENRFRNRLNIKISSETGIKKKVSKLLLNSYKISRIMKIIFSKISIKEELVNSYLNALNKIEEPIDVIIPASMPFESVVVASKFRGQYNNIVKIIPYLFDQFVDNKSLHRFDLNMKFKRKRHLELEKIMLKNASSVLIMYQLKAHFFSELPSFKKKLFIVEHPLLKEYPEINEENISGIKIVYAGSFYKNIRNPEYFLKIAEKSLANIEAKIDLYTFGNCNEIINRYSNINSSIVNHGKVSTERAYNAISKGSILIAVGNSDNSQVPSKIFEYLSFGKPIIYFYSNDNDTNLKILSKYNLLLCLKQDFDKFEENIRLFVEFCKKHSNSHIPYKEVENMFYDATPKYTADLILKICEKFNR